MVTSVQPPSNLAPSISRAFGCWPIGANTQINKPLFGKGGGERQGERQRRRGGDRGGGVKEKERDIERAKGRGEKERGGG